jgi:hypothetical protein
MNQEAFQMCISVRFACPVVEIVSIEWGKFFQPNIDVLNQPVLGIVDVDTCRYVHCRYKHNPVVDVAVRDNTGNFISNVNVFSKVFCSKPEVFRLKFHEYGCSSLYNNISKRRKKGNTLTYAPRLHPSAFGGSIALGAPGYKKGILVIRSGASDRQRMPHSPHPKGAANFPSANHQRKADQPMAENGGQEVCMATT